ncbi:MAG TPA: dienelactone hydrolase family protein [Thermoanaerobaculia bacterium]|jgi:carboxymethylenebutenolidase|nr:dienelactone hydrolase family protein [Thermoanaerobaculia bacterium]
MTHQALLTILALMLIPAVARADDAQTAAARMAQEHQHDKPSPTPAATQEPSHPVSGEEVTYAQVDGKPTRGYLARPKEAKGNLPALVVIHEWWGLNDNIRAMTRRLAGEGYQALAVDLYGGAVADTPDGAMKLMNGVMSNMAPAADNLKQAVTYLKGKGATRIGVIGWCFGGGWSLQTTLLAPADVKATVLYYGHLETDPAKLAVLKTPVIGFFGADDKSIPVDGIHAFEAQLKKQGTPVEVHVYDGAGHAFANPSGGSFRPEAAKDAWQRTTAFFAKYLKG